MTISRPGPTLGCVFYRSSVGQDPVKEWLDTIPREAKKQIGQDVMAVQFRWPIVGRSLVEGLGDDLFAVRTASLGGEYRTFFTVTHNAMLILHAFQKKTKKIPRRHIEIARSRMP